MKPASSRRRTILAVDDKIDNLKILIKYLENSGFELMVAQGGEEALKRTERINTDIKRARIVQQQFLPAADKMPLQDKMDWAYCFEPAGRWGGLF